MSRAVFLWIERRRECKNREKIGKIITRQILSINSTTHNTQIQCNLMSSHINFPHLSRISIYKHKKHSSNRFEFLEVFWQFSTNILHRSDEKFLIYSKVNWTYLYTARLSASNCAWSISFAFDVDVFVFDVISLPFSFPTGDVSDDVDDDDAVTLFSCIFFTVFTRCFYVLGEKFP